MDATQPRFRLEHMADSLPDRHCGGRSGSGHYDGRSGGPPEEIGHKVAAALVGTFLGILLC